MEISYLDTNMLLAVEAQMVQLLPLLTLILLLAAPFTVETALLS